MHIHLFYRASNERRDCRIGAPQLLFIVKEIPLRKVLDLPEVKTVYQLSEN